MPNSKGPGFWTTKASDQFRVNLPQAAAAAACREAGAQTKGWRIAESDANRVLATHGPGLINARSFHVEVLLTDAPDGGSTLTLNGWTFGKGAGMTKMVENEVGQFRAAIEEQLRAH